MAIPTIDLAYGALGLALVAVVLAIWGLTSAARVRRRYLSAFGDERPENVEQLVAALHERLDASLDRFDGFFPKEN